MSNLLYFPAWMKVLQAIHDGNQTKTDIFKNTGVQYAYVTKIIDEFEETQLVNTRKKGRRVIITLTQEGEKLANYTNKILDEVQE